MQYLLGHSTSAMVRRYSATYDAAKAASAHVRFSPAARLLTSGDAPAQAARLVRRSLLSDFSSVGGSSVLPRIVNDTSPT